MFTWICNRALVGLAAVLALAGCTGGADVSVAALGLTRSAPQTIAVAQRSVVIGGPAGYCIDRKGSRLNGDSAFVVLAGCGADGSASQARHALGLLTASVGKKRGDGPSMLAAPDALESFFASDAGRAALARDGQAASVEIWNMMRQDGAVLIRLSDSSQSEMVGVEDVYWRGLTEVNGRLVTISVLSFADRPLGSEPGLAKLRAFLARIRAESPRQVAVN